MKLARHWRDERLIQMPVLPYKMGAQAMHCNGCRCPVGMSFPGSCSRCMACSPLLFSTLPNNFVLKCDRRVRRVSVPCRQHWPCPELYGRCVNHQRERAHGPIPGLSTTITPIYQHNRQLSHVRIGSAQQSGCMGKQSCAMP